MSSGSDLRLNGLNPLSYQGVNPYTPVPFFTKGKSNYPSIPTYPTENDYQNFTIGTIWLDQINEVAYMLVGFTRPNAVTTYATWVPFVTGFGILAGLKGNSGGFVGPTGFPAAPYINVIGDGTTVNVVGNPATHTLTVSVVGSGVVSTLTGDFGTATPLAGNINVIAGVAALNSGSSVYIQGSAHTLTLNVTDSNHNTAIGNDAGTATLSGTGTTALGYQAASNYTTTEGYNTVVGYANKGLATEKGIVRIGAYATNNLNNNSNTFVGYNAGNDTYTLNSGGSQGSDNTFIGAFSGIAITTANANCCLGQAAGAVLSSGSDNVFIGANSGAASFVTGVSTGTNNTSVGNDTMWQSNGSYNSVYGNNSGSAWTGTESHNIAISNLGQVGDANVIRLGTYGSGTEQQNKCYIAACYSNYGTNNTFVGELAGNTTLTVGSATANTTLGTLSGSALTTGISNCFMGVNSGLRVSSGSINCLLGTNSGANITTGGYNVGVGEFAFVLPLTSGLTTGSYNIGIGAGNYPAGPHSPGDSYTSSEASNIIIGNNPGVNGESNTIRIGSLATGSGTAQQNACFIAGIRGITTGNNNAIAVLIDSAGQLGTVSSSARYKNNIRDMDSFSEPIMQLKPKVFNFKKQNSLSAGLIAEEVAEIFPWLVVFDDEGEPSSVKYHDLAALLLNELIKLKAEFDEFKITCQKN